jgi:uncharacterized SAM-binding protein YcdF (DUF218 family)
MSSKKILQTIVFGIIPMMPFLLWIVLVAKGARFALRDRLRKADAIVVLAGTRGNLDFLQGKIRTAVRLYREGWAPLMICTGKFSLRVSEKPALIPEEELLAAVAKRRIQEKDLTVAVTQWDRALGACYMRDQAVAMGVPPEAILVENESLHTKENAELVLALLQEHQMRRIILVTSPFHQQRTYLTFAKVSRPHHIDIINYYADTGEWHPATWFVSAQHRKLVKSERERIKRYRIKGDIL